jgi:hypothetical protein
VELIVFKVYELRVKVGVFKLLVAEQLLDVSNIIALPLLVLRGCFSFTRARVIYVQSFLSRNSEA